MVQKYKNGSRHLLAQATQELAQGDVRQASEKGWGATAQMVKAVAARKRWPHRTHGALYRVVDRLAQETGDNDIRRLFQIASNLHTNFYEDWDTANGVASGLQDVQDLLNKLEPLN